MTNIENNNCLSIYDNLSTTTNLSSKIFKNTIPIVKNSNVKHFHLPPYRNLEDNSHIKVILY